MLDGQRKSTEHHVGPASLKLLYGIGPTCFLQAFTLYLHFIAYPNSFCII